jgi:cytochrome c biogenesis protein CcdA
MTMADAPDPNRTLTSPGDKFMLSRLSALFNDSEENVRGKIVGVYVLLIAANVAAWVWALVAFRDFPLLLGTAFLAYSFGLRHAFDADHIAAIDNVTRKLMQEGKRPIGVGLFFSLGHSTLVVGLTLVIAITANALQSRSDAFRTVGSVIGVLVSAFFLFAIALANIIVMVSIYRTFRTVKQGGPFVEEDLDLMLANRGLLGRLFRRFFRLIEQSWQMYPLGLLFGLGFDTATEVGPRHRRDAGFARIVDLVDPGVSGAVHGRHDAARYDGQYFDAGRLRLGFREADPQALLQPHHHGGVGRRRGGRRRPRSVESHRRSAGPDPERRLLGRDRFAQR